MYAVATGLNGWAYLLVLTFHLVCVIVGFGGVTLNGLWGSTLSKTTGEAAGPMAITLGKVSHLAEYFIYGVPVFGVLAILLSDKSHSFASPWVSIALVLYFLGIGLSAGILLPTSKKLEKIAMAGNPVSAERKALEKKMAAISGALHLILVTVILLMVFGPTTSWLLKS